MLSNELLHREELASLKVPSSLTLTLTLTLALTLPSLSCASRAGGGLGLGLELGLANLTLTLTLTLTCHALARGGERGIGRWALDSRPGVGGRRLSWVRLGVCDHDHAPVADEREHEGRASHVHDRHGLCAQERRGASSARQCARARMQDRSPSARAP